MTPSDIASQLAGSAEQVASYLVPTGRRQGSQWVASSIHGGDGDSFKICLTGIKAGVFKDFADSEPGGDLLDLWARIRCNGNIGDAICEAKEYLGIQDDGYHFTSPPKHIPKPVVLPETVTEAKKIIAWFAKRGISEATVNAYHVKEEPGVIVFPYERDGKTWMLKYRGSKKKIWTSKDPHKILFGWQSVPESCRAIVLTEGEPDAMAYHEQGIPAMSIPYGAGSGGKIDWIENEYEHLERFDTIYLSMDMDEEGQATVPHLCERLGRHRCRVVNLPLKDANECLMDGMELQAYLDLAVTVDPKELRPASDFIQDVIREFYPVDELLTGMTLPWVKTHSHVRIRPGEVSIWVGINGHGKTLVLDHICVSSINTGEKWCIASMEMMPAKHLKRMYRQISGIEDPTHDIIYSVNDYLSGGLWLFDVRGTAKAQRILDVFAYARKRYGITQFIVDSLAKCGFAEDDYNRQKDFVDQLTDFAKEHTCHIHLVAHGRKGENEAQAPGKMDVKGTGALTDMVDNVFSVWRNKPKEAKAYKIECDGGNVPIDLSQKPDAVIDVHKQRNGEWEKQIGLFFHKTSQRYLEDYGQPVVPYTRKQWE